MGIPRVLIIDDNEVARRTLSGLLRLEGFDTLTAETGGAGVRLALAEGTDVILVDLHLPDISGIEVVRALKARGISVPMVIVTVFPDLETSFSAEDVGAAGYVEGLLSADELVQVVLAALNGTLPIIHPAIGFSRAPSAKPPRQVQPTAAVSLLPKDERVRRVVRAIEDENDTAWSNAALARRVHMSTSRLRHLFAETLGLPLARFKRERRLQAAARFLLTTTESFRSIAERLRMPRDLRVVRGAFRARFGMSPRAYRRRFSSLIQKK